MRSYPVDWYHQVPGPVKEIIERLQYAGKKAWIVGGAVRDLFLNQTPKDFDIVSDASPDEIEALFPKTLAVGKQFGIMMVITELGPVEVAQFRSDAEYRDGRHPEAVALNVDPSFDAARRDFTVNALYFDPVTSVVVDFVGGIEDIHNRVIRCVGEPVKRFEEDALRMLRAIRFFAQLAHTGFIIERATIDGIQICASRIRQVSRERITQEFSKILASESPAPAIALLRSTGLWAQIFKFPYPGDEAILTFQKARDLYRSEQQNTQLFPLFLYIASQASEAEPDPTEFVLSSAEKNAIANLPRSVMELERLDSGTLADKKIALSNKLFHLAWAILSAQETCPEWVKNLAAERKILLEKGTLSPPMLLNGEDIKALGISEGPKIKGILQTVRRKQLEETISTKEEALDLANRLKSTS